jgi:hypothetical protein
MSDEIQNISTKLEHYLLPIANIENYYNALLRVIRVEYGGKYYDLKCDPGFHVPNREDHLVLATLPENFFTDNDSISEFQERLAPGQITEEGRSDNLAKGIAFLIPRRQSISSTAPISPNAGFDISDTNMFERDNVSVAISPFLPDTDYTTLKEANSTDNEYKSVGLFINKQGTVLLKGSGGAITIGKEGVHIGCKLHTVASVKNTGVMTENPLGKLLGSTIPTAAASWPTIPNIGTIVAVANAASKFIRIVDTVSTARDIIKNATNETS